MSSVRERPVLAHTLMEAQHPNRSLKSPWDWPLFDHRTISATETALALKLVTTMDPLKLNRPDLREDLTCEPR